MCWRGVMATTAASPLRAGVRRSICSSNGCFAAPRSNGSVSAPGRLHAVTNGCSRKARLQGTLSAKNLDWGQSFPDPRWPLDLADISQSLFNRRAKSGRLKPLSQRSVRLRSETENDRLSGLATVLPGHRLGRSGYPAPVRLGPVPPRSPDLLRCPIHGCRTSVTTLRPRRPEVQAAWREPSIVAGGADDSTAPCADMAAGRLGGLLRARTGECGGPTRWTTQRRHA